MSRAMNCMEFVNSSKAREAFWMLMKAQSKSSLPKEVRPRTNEEIAAIKADHKAGMNWTELGQKYNRAPSFCRACCLR